MVSRAMPGRRLAHSTGAHLTLVWLLTAPGWLPLLAGRQIGTHDGYYHLYRMFELLAALRVGDLYPRWASEFALGYGYPVFNYYPPLILYLAAPLALAGLGPIGGLNLAQLGATLLAGASGYLLARDLFGRLAGVMAGTLYGSLPYLMVDLYVRGAVAETLALGLLPLVVWALRRVAVDPSRQRGALAGGTVALLALAHNITSLLGLPLAVLFAMLGVTSGAPRTACRSVAAVAASVALGLLAAAIYWLPALIERDLVTSEVLTTLFYDFHNHFQPLRHVAQATLLFEYRYDYFAGFLFRAGLAQLALALAGSALALVLLPAHRWTVIFWLAVALGALLLQSSRSSLLWEHAPLLAYTQFPWRMLAPFGLASALLVAAGLAAAASRQRPLGTVVGLMAVLLIWLAASFLQLRPALLDLRQHEVSLGALNRVELERRLIGTTTAGEYTPRWERRGLFTAWPEPPPAPAPGVAAQRLLGADRTSLRVEVAAPAGGELVLDRYFFPGWRATVDGWPTAVRPLGDRGLLAADVPAGTREVAFAFGDTPLRRGAAMLSALGWLVLATLLVVPARPSWRGLAAAARAIGVMVLAGLGSLGIALAGPAEARPVTAVLARPAQFEGGPRLLGLTDDGGGQLSLYWATTGPVDRDLTVALRLLAPNGSVVARRDKAPRFGLRPTRGWTAGAIVRDVQQIELLPAAARWAGQPLDLVVGLHDANGYVRPVGAEDTIWREECPCVGPGSDGLGVWTGRLTLSAPPDRTVSPRATPAGPIAAGRIQLLDYDLQPSGAAYDEHRPTWAPLLDRLSRRLPGLSAVRPDRASPTTRPGGPAGVGATLEPGAALDLQLRWRALADVGEDFAVFTHLLDHRQRLIAQDDEWPRRGFSPTSLWHTGQETLDPFRLRLPLDAQPGRHTLAVGLYRRVDLSRLRWSGDPPGRDQIVLGAVKVAPQAPAEPPRRAASARFGSAIELIGFDDEVGARQLRAGSVLTIAPRWRAAAVPERDYTVFVHLIDAGGRLIANGDAPPLSGGFPTSLWEPGETIVDAFDIPVPGDARGRGQVLLGLYRADTGERLRTGSGADSIVAAELEIVGP